jgi:hypothetical protein
VDKKSRECFVSLTVNKSTLLKKNNLLSLVPTHNTTQSICTAASSTTVIADSGATDLFLKQSDAIGLLEDVRPSADFDVSLPNGQMITAIAEGTLTL